MSTSLRAWSACRAIAVRSRPLMARPGFTSQATPVSRSYSATTPTTSTQTTTVVANDAPADRIDDEMLETLLYGGRLSTSQQEGGLTEAQEEMLYRGGAIPPAQEAAALLAQDAAQGVSARNTLADGMRNPGHKFPLPQQPYPEGFNMKQRYHPVLEQLSRLMMRDGKLSVAQRNMALVMNHLRTAPAPIYSPKFPLLPGTPPASHLPLNPVLYIAIAIDSVAPLVKVKAVAGAAGGGRSLEVPVPLTVRQRRRTAFMWILDVVDKKPSKGSGRNQFAIKVAEEIIAVVEGRSGVWDKRKLVHKVGTTARANVGKKLNMKKKK